LQRAFVFTDKIFRCLWNEFYLILGDLISTQVEKCDVFVGIFGHLYGSCPQGDEKSYTVHEYEAAVENKKPRLMFFAPEEFPVPSGIRKTRY